MKLCRYLIAALLITLLSACTGTPEGIEPVNNFELERYLGRWYEIARLDHSFEEGLQDVTAEYALRKDGSVGVTNRGYRTEDGEWEVATGTARFVGSTETGHLEVSFFGPFYSSYLVFSLPDRNYRTAYVTGYNRNYLWLLSRTPTITAQQKDAFHARVSELGFNLDEVIWVEQSGEPH